MLDCFSSCGFPQAASRHKALKLGPELVMLVGMLIIAVSMFLLGPSPLLPLRSNLLSVTVISLMLLGLGQSMVCTAMEVVSAY